MKAIVMSVLMLGLFCTTANAQAPRPHPYLYFTAEELPAIRERLTREPFATRWQQFLQAADAHLRSTPSRELNPRRQLGIVGLTSFAYAITGERQYGERAKAEMMAMFEHPWHEDLGYNKGANLGTAECSVAAALFYDWCHDLLTDEERQQYRARVLERSTRIYLQSIEQYKDWWVANLVSNWAGVCHGGCGLAALAMYDEEPEARKAADLSRRYVTRFLKAALLEDGGGHEGVMYWRYGTEFGHYMASASRRFYGKDDGLYAQTVKDLSGYWDVYMLASDGQYANFNNMDEGTFKSQPRWHESGTNAGLAALFEAQVPGGDELLLWAADNGHSAYYWEGASPFYFLWRRPDAPPATQKPQLQDVALFRGNGHAILQSPTLWLAFSGGWTSDLSHNNQDLGTFVLVANGERFVSDPGYGRSSTGEHSTILVQGRGQLRRAQGRYTAFGSGEGFHYLANDLSDAYAEPLKRFTRHVIMVDGRYVVLLDDLALGEAQARKFAPASPQPAEDNEQPPLLPARYAIGGPVRPAPETPADPNAKGSNFQWRLQTRRTIEVSGQSASLKGKGTVTVLPVLPSDGQLETITVESTAGANARAGRRQSFTALALTPAEFRDEEAMLVVLYPTAEGEPSGATTSFSRQGDSAILTVTAPDDKADRIEFAINAGQWRLKSVNGASAEDIKAPSERVLVPFRK